MSFRKDKNNNLNLMNIDIIILHHLFDCTLYFKYIITAVELRIVIKPHIFNNVN